MLGRHLDRKGMPTPLAPELEARLCGSGIKRLVLGHTPHGNCPTVIKSTNADGHGVQVFHIGRWDAAGMVEARRSGRLSEAAFLEHWTYANEYVALQLEALSHRRGELAGLQLVCDFRGASLRQISRAFFKMVGPWAAMSQDNYPSTSADIVFLNAPGFFSAAWGLVSPMVGEQTASKIRFASTADEG